MAYIKFELRSSRLDRARGIFEHYRLHPHHQAWVQYAKFEGGTGTRGYAPDVYEALCSGCAPSAGWCCTLSYFQFRQQYKYHYLHCWLYIAVSCV
jgi:hypothetical protein